MWFTQATFKMHFKLWWVTCVELGGRRPVQCDAPSWVEQWLCKPPNPASGMYMYACAFIKHLTIPDCNQWAKFRLMGHKLICRSNYATAQLLTLLNACSKDGIWEPVTLTQHGLRQLMSQEKMAPVREGQNVGNNINNTGNISLKHTSYFICCHMILNDTHTHSL